MAKKIILAADVRKGDSLKVTYMDRGMEETRTGVADYQHLNNSENWYNKDGVLFYTHLLSATIQLLDRPKPEPLVPSRDSAIIKYTVDFDEHFPVRTAIRSKSGGWVCYNDKGNANDDYATDADFIEFLTESKFTPEVIFGGIAK